MRRGVWHQCGDRSQKLAAEQIQHGVGVGVVISPRDLTLDKADEYAQEYHQLGAHVLIDQQFYTPDAVIGKLDSYPIAQYRASISQLHQISDTDLAGLAQALQDINTRVQADGIIAPAVVYESGRPEIAELNARLFAAARAVADALGKPAYATIIVGHSATATDATINDVLSHATSLDADGWYFAFEFDGERIPSDLDAVRRCCEASLTLACSGKPLFQAYAGPLALLSHGCGATATGLGHSQNLWRFDRGRWEPQAGQGGGGDAPARYFSRELWGTIIHPDESAQLPQHVAAQILTPSPFAAPWDRWQANKHLVNVIGSTVGAMSATVDARANANAAIAALDHAIQQHANIAALGIALRDDTGSYQANWRSAMAALLAARSNDYDYLAMLP